jgi:medium-chain acyl-[acyl-carrier-protein] hydrolase
MATLTASNKWLVCRNPRPEAQVRLVAVPPAGSGPGLYADWTSALPAWVELWLVVAPGRENRFSESVPRRLVDHVEAIAAALLLMDPLPVALFGHSMGGIVAFEVARRLRDAGRSVPHHLFLSGVRAPLLPRNYEPEHQLPTSQLLHSIRRRYGGLPAEVETHPELLEWSLELLRRDLRALETYHYRPADLLSMPISVLGGDADPSVPVDDLRAWAWETDHAFTLRVFAGDHRFLEGQRDAVLECVRDHLSAIGLGHSTDHTGGRCA